MTTSMSFASPTIARASWPEPAISTVWPRRRINLAHICAMASSSSTIKTFNRIGKWGNLFSGQPGFQEQPTQNTRGLENRLLPMDTEWAVSEQVYDVAYADL